MIVITASGTLTTAEEMTVVFEKLQGGYQVIQLEVSVTNTTNLDIKGIDNLFLQSIEEVSGASENIAWDLRTGIELAGDLGLKLTDLQQFVKNRVLEINGIPQFIFNQSTGADVSFAILMVLQEI